MISLQLNLRNPFSTRWECIKCWAGQTPFKHKFWEVQLDKTSDLISFELRYTIRQDHAGLFLTFGLVGYEVILHLYDNRHWNDEEGRWKFYTENEGYH